MAIKRGKNFKSAHQAQFDAQKIAFAPIMFQAARCLVKFGILEVLNNSKNGISTKNVATKCNISEYAAKVLLEAGLHIEVVEEKNDLFFLTKTGWFLLTDDLTIANMNFVHDVNYNGFYYLDEALLNGKPEGLKVFGKWDTIYQALSELPEQVRKSWFEFDHYYSDFSFPLALPIIFSDNPKKILDIGGNTGKFAIECATFNPDVKVTILDLPGQLKDAEKNIKKAGFENRIDLQSINILNFDKDYPKGYDVVWMSQFLDCFSQEQIVKILLNVKETLNPNGKIFIMETFWDNQKTVAGSYCLTATSLYFTCMANGNSQMYKFDDMAKLIEKAGLKISRTHDNIGISHTIVECTI